MVSTLEPMQVPNGTGPGVRRSKRPLLASRTRCNVLMKPPKFSKLLLYALFYYNSAVCQCTINTVNVIFKTIKRSHKVV